MSYPHRPFQLSTGLSTTLVDNLVSFMRKTMVSRINRYKRILLLFPIKVNVFHRFWDFFRYFKCAFMRILIIQHLCRDGFVDCVKKFV